MNKAEKQERSDMAAKILKQLRGLVKGDQFARNTKGERLNHKPGFDVLERKRRRARGKLRRNARKLNRKRQRYKGL